MARTRASTIAVVGLVLTAAGILFPIAWDHYKSRKALTLEVLGSSRLASASQEAEGLKLSYKGRPVQNLTKLELALVNTGRTPLSAQDVLEPVRIVLDSGEILDFRLTGASPANIGATLASADTGRRAFTVAFPLLNPRDEIDIAVLATGQPTLRSADARITGVQRIAVAKRGGERLPAWRRLPWKVYLVGGFALLAGLLLAGTLFVFGVEHAYANLWRRVAFAVPDGADPEVFSAFLAQVIGLDRIPEPKSAKKPVKAAPAATPVTAEQRLVRLLGGAASDLKTILGGVIVFLVLFLIGLGYVLLTIP